MVLLTIMNNFRYIFRVNLEIAKEWLDTDFGL